MGSCSGGSGWNRCFGSYYLHFSTTNATPNPQPPTTKQPQQEIDLSKLEINKTTKKPTEQPKQTTQDIKKDKKTYNAYMKDYLKKYRAAVRSGKHKPKNHKK